MDVRCSRCGTEYEFDDALISERGTTVKCTNCGFQFKIFPGAGHTPTPERWIVHTASGHELVYTSLRQLQRGIAERDVSANDSLSRGDQAPRPLGSIAELEPFFRVTAGAKPKDLGQRALHEMASPAKVLGLNSADPELSPSESALAAPAFGLASGPAQSGIDLSQRLPKGSIVPSSSQIPMAGTPMSPRVASVASWDSTGEAPISARSPVSSPRNLPPIEVESIRDSFKSYDELQLDGQVEEHHARAARSRWIAGVVAIGVLGLLSATVGRRYLAQLTGAAEVKGTSDARVAKFLNDGARRADEGDFEAAKEEFDKAAALAEKDPAVLSALARLETLRADVYWLKLRLIDPSSTELVQATSRELEQRVSKAQTAVDRAFAISPEDPAVLRARVDALRLSGDGDKAREWLAPLSANASLPENAYVLAALDMAEPNPVWPTVIDRLRTAAAAERDPGRARAALIYAFAKANRVSEAAEEFAKIDGRAKPHPLLEELRAFLQRAQQPPDAAESAAPNVPALETSKPAPPAATPAATPAVNEEELRAANGDFRARLARAATALRHDDLSRAEQLYRSVLQEQPMNSEATSGLGDVAKARHDSARAAEMYDRALTGNPSYLPALSARADQKWNSGDKVGALVLYRRLLDQTGQSSDYGSRAAARIAEGVGPGDAGAPEGSGGAAQAAPPNEAPAIDSSDAPGAK